MYNIGVLYPCGYDPDMFVKSKAYNLVIGGETVVGEVIIMEY